MTTKHYPVEADEYHGILQETPKDFSRRSIKG